MPVAAKLKTGKAGLEIIKRNEGLRLTAYQDVVGVWTIGYGDTGDVYPGQTITRKEAEQRLVNRLAREFEPGVRDAIENSPTTQNQFDAMVSLAYNIGVGRFQSSSIAENHALGNYREAANAFRLYNKAGGVVLDGLVRRREEERTLYLSKSPKPTPGPTPEPSPEPPATDNADLDDALLAQGSITRIIQRELGLKVDGDYGPGTRDAVRAYLKIRG